MRHLLTLAALLFVTCEIHAQPPSYVPTNGLVGWWPFNGNANDESGGGNDGVVVGPLTALDRFGTANAAFAFAGGNDRINVGNTLIASPSITSYSISAWFSSQQTTAGCIVSDRSDADWSYKYSLAMRGDLAGEGRFSTHDGASLLNDLPGAQPGLNNGEWTHFVAVLDMSIPEMRLYFNGVLDTASAVLQPMAWSASSSGTVFGNWLSPGGWYLNAFEGLLDDIGIWDRVLTEEEVSDLFLTNTPCISSTPVSFTGLNSSYTTTDGPTTLSGAPAGGVFIGPGITGTTFNPAAAGEGTHSIIYTYLDSNACVNSAGMCTAVSIGMSQEPVRSTLSGVLVYPNPNHGQFTVELELSGLVSMQVFDARGRQVHGEVFLASGAKITRSLDLSAFAAGAYTLLVENNGQRVNQRVMVR
ncbi:MAG: LamG-like jellyroll fold domain-containing protein [Flavobacteriales bacterium]